MSAIDALGSGASGQMVSMSAIVSAMGRIMVPAEIRAGCRRGFVAYMRLAISRDAPYMTAATGRHRDYLLSTDAAAFVLDHCTPSFALLAIKKQIIAGRVAMSESGELTDAVADAVRYIVHGAGPGASEADVVAAAKAVYDVTSALVPERLRQVTKCAAAAALAHLAGSEV